jgi:beta-phosphoglucomutase-like phosphatase (HAD superfamily)
VRINDTTLDEWFDVDVCGREFPRGKPDPAIFLAAAEELRLPPQECLVVEDAPSGIVAAKAGGMYAIGIARFDDEQLLRDAGADEVVTSLDDIGGNANPMPRGRGLPRPYGGKQLRR